MYIKKNIAKTLKAIYTTLGIILSNLIWVLMQSILGGLILMKHAATYIDRVFYRFMQKP